eukprot:5372015-Pyramimonas_sp.AAC.1
MPALIKETVDAVTIAGQPASSSAGPPAPMGADALMMSQDTRGMNHSIIQGTFAFAIQSTVENALETWRRRDAAHSGKPSVVDQDFAARDCRRRYAEPSTTSAP